MPDSITFFIEASQYVTNSCSEKNGDPMARRGREEFS